VLPRLSESLAGRMEVLTLWPFSQGELHGAPDGFVDRAFAKTLPGAPVGQVNVSDLVARVVAGGYPEVVSALAPRRRAAWFGSYLSAILQRDVRDLANVSDLAAFPRLLALVASRPMGLLNAADLSRGIGVPQTSVKRYLALLEGTFLLQLVPPWFVNIGKRLVKAPKVSLVDTGLSAHLLGADAHRLAQDPTLFGGLLENFVVAEIRKQIGWSRIKPNLCHFRSHDGHEVDVVLEAPDGRVVGIEVKSAMSVGAGDFRGLRLLCEACGPRFHRGVVLHPGLSVVPFGRALHAVPIGALWAWHA
jgi:uncharacterized protein